jgi:hypothetical protein
MATDALERALRVMLAIADGGSLRGDLGRALVDAANAVLDNQGFGRVLSPDDLNEMFGLDLRTGSADDDTTGIPLDDPETATRAIAGLLETQRDLLEVIEAVADDCSVVDEFNDEEDLEVDVYACAVDDAVYYFDVPWDADTATPTWRFDHNVEGAVPRAYTRPDTTDPDYATRVLEHALRPVLRGADSGSLRDDVAWALVAAAKEVRDNVPAYRGITITELNVMLGLDIGEGYSDEQKDRYDIDLENREEAASGVAEFLISDWDLHGVINRVAGSCSLLDVSPDGALGVYEFTVDDGVYYFDYAGDFEICQPSWWFGHTVNDSDAREIASGVGPRELWDEALYRQEHPEEF